MTAMTRAVVAEFVATFALVFVSAGAVVVDAVAAGGGGAGPIGHGGAAVAAGLVVMTMIYAVGDTSGAHLNPAVSIGFWASGRFPAWKLPGYIGAQLLASLAGAALLAAMFSGAGTMGATSPQHSVWQSFALEIVLTTILMFVILTVALGAKEKGLMAGVAIGGTVAMNCLWAGPISGSSMNPARSLGPAVFGGGAALLSLWVYFVAPVIGAVVAVGLWRAVHETAVSVDTSHARQ